MSQKLLIVRPDRAGDALKTLPTVRALVAMHKDWQIEVLSSEFNSSLFSFEHGIKCHSLPQYWEKLNPGDLRYQIENLLEKTFDVAVLLPCDSDANADQLFKAIDASEKWSRWSAHGKILSEDPVGHDERDNIARLVARAIGQPVNWAGFSAAPVLSEHDRSEASHRLGEKIGNRFVLCPFASMKRRSLGDGHVVSLIRSLAKSPQTQSVILPGVASDYDRFEQLRRRADVGEKLETIYPTSFRTLAAYLEKCTGLIGVDSGPLHLAMAIGLPTLGFLGGCDKARWYPMEDSASHLVHRGYFDRFPTRLGVHWHLRNWLKAKTDAARISLALQGPVPVLF